jgi:hypothetical protein
LGGEDQREADEEDRGAEDRLSDLEEGLKENLPKQMVEATVTVMMMLEKEQADRRYTRHQS